MFGLTTWLKIGAGAAVALAVALAYNHYTGLLRDRETLKSNAAVMELALEEQKAATEAAESKVDEWRDAFTQLQEDIQGLAETQKRSRDELRRLQSIFSKHDLATLALERPDLVEPRINAGSARINRLLQCASGASDFCEPDPSQS